MRFSLGCRTGRTLLHQCSYPEPRGAVLETRHTTGDSGAEESGARGCSPEDALLGGCKDGGLGGDEDGADEDGALELGGHGLADPEGGADGVPPAPGDRETHGSGEDGEVEVPGLVGGVGVVTVTEGEGRTGGSALWSL